ncbi:MAG TPA: Calx-beta domain-containing protein [Thermoanaerobaculia bacterium]|nr:Calx-beta domain-containing protein [Thermoanaerobaculia bacterium]
MNPFKRFFLFAAASAFCLSAYATSATPPTPVIDSVSPTVITASLTPQTYTITGHDFLSGAAVIVAPSVGSGSINLAQSVTVVSATKITFTVQCLPTESAAVDVYIMNPNGREYSVSRGAMTMQAQLSDLTPIIIDTTGDSSDADPRDITTVVRAMVTPHSSATLVFDGIIPVPRLAYAYKGVVSATDDDGDGVVAFHSLAVGPGRIMFVVIDAAGVMHKTMAPFQEALPDSNWYSSQPHPERSPDGTMSRYDFDIRFDAAFLWVRPGVGSWFVFPADHNAISDADGIPFWDEHIVVPTTAFQPVSGTASGPPPASFAPSDVVALLDDQAWSIERLPSPLTGSAGGSIRLFFNTTKEGTGATIYVRRISGSEGTVSVNYHTVDGTARAGVDYVAKSGTVTFAPGEYVKTFSISTIDDGVYGNGYRNLSLAITADAATVPISSYPLNISDAQDPPVISIDDVRINEGDVPSTLQVPVRLTGRTAVMASVHLYTFDDHQNYGSTQTLTFAPGETLKFISIPYTGNSTPGPDRTITIHLESPVNAILHSTTAVVTIVDDDTQTLSVNDIQAEEQSQTADFLVTMSRAVGVPVTVHYATFDGTATAPLDYTSTSGTLTFAPGEIVKTVSVQVVHDQIADPDETFTLKLSDAAGATITKSIGTATLLESDRLPQPVVLIDDIAVAEGNSGTTDATFNVRLSFASALPVVVAWRTENGSAHDDSDYTAGSGRLTFPPGETSLPLTVKINGDTTPESNETFRLVVIAASNAIVGNGATCTIVDDDSAPPVPPRRRSVGH